MKQIVSIIILGLILQSVVIYAQSPIIEWYKLYNGTSGNCVEQTSDSGYIIVGEVWGAGSQDLHLIKTNSIGDTIWTRRYEGSNINSNGYSVHQSFDGGFIATGVYYDLTYYADLLYIVKTDANGDLLWSRTFKGASPHWGNAGFSITQVPDSGFVAVGYSQLWGLGDDVFMVKLTNDGDTSWVHHYGGNQWERGYSVIPTSDSGLVVAGSIRPVSTLDYWDNPWFMKTNAAGNTQWIKTFNWPYVDVARSIQQTPDGGYLAVGYTNSFGTGDFDYFLMKLDAEGDSSWFKTYGTNHSGRCYSIESLTDGNYILAGTEHVVTVNTPRIVLIKVNPLGDTLWTKIITGDGGQPLSGFCVDETFDNGYVITGQLVNTYLVKLLEEPVNVEENLKDANNFNYILFENYPNPFNPSTKISWQSPIGSWQTIKVYDVLGNEIVTLVDEYKPAGQYEVEFSAISRLASGIFFYQLKSGEFIQTKKMILLR